MNAPCKEHGSRARWRQAIASSLLGGLFGAVAGVLSTGLLGLIFGYSSVVQHADNLFYGLESLFVGAVLLVIMFGLPIGMPIGGVLGLMIGGVVGVRGGKRQKDSVQGAKASEDPLQFGRSKGPWLTRRRALAWAAATVLVGALIAPIVSRRRELAELRAQGDAVQDVVAKLGGRPDFGPSYVRMVDLGGSSVTDEDFIKLTEAKGFRLVDGVFLSEWTCSSYNSV